MTDSFRMTECFCPVTSSSGYRTNSVRVTGVVVVFVCIFNCIFLRGRQVGHAGWVGYNSVRTHSDSGNRDATHCAQGRVQSQLASASSQHRRSPQDTAPVLQGSDRRRKLEGRIWNPRGRPMHRHWDIPAPLSRARVGVRLQPTPAAAPSAEPYHPDSSRLVCRSRSGSLRAGTPPSRHDRGVGVPKCFGTDRSLRRGTWRFRGQNKVACGMVGPLAFSLSP